MQVDESPAVPAIALHSVRLGPEVEELVLGVLRSGMLAQGPLVERLEAEFGELIGADHVIAVNSGTTALIATLELLDLRPGDEVITSPFTFAATLNAIIRSGATARFADVNAADFCLDAGSARAACTERTLVLLPVHLFGQCADMPRLSAVAEDWAMTIVEDAAQAHGARIDGKAAGTWGIGCFSLYATKNLTSAEGGLITTGDATLADRLRVLRNQGMRERHVYEAAGSNYRLTDLQAAICLPQLARYEAQVAARQRNADRLSAGLRHLTGLRVPESLPGRHHVWHQYTVLVDDGARFDRDSLRSALTERGIGCAVYYPRLVFDHDCYRGHPQIVVGDVGVARGIADRCLSLPVHADLSDDDLDRIIETMTELLGAG